MSASLTFGLPWFGQAQEDSSPVHSQEHEEVCASMGTVGFDWDGIEPSEEDEKRVIEEKARVLAFRFLGSFVRQLAKYLVEEGRSRVSGAGIRAYVFAWFVEPKLRKLKQSELAALLNLQHKQSVGREASKFRDAFGVICPHMQSEAARAACRKREESKRLDVEFKADGESDFVPEIERKG